jgi:hypothetical protein
MLAEKITAADVERGRRLSGKRVAYSGSDSPVMLSAVMGKHIPVAAESTPSTPPWAADLTDKERRFVEAYVISLSGVQAAAAAGLGKTRKSASEMASKWRKKPAIANAISMLMTEKSGLAGVSVVNEIAAIAYSRIRSSSRPSRRHNFRSFRSCIARRAMTAAANVRGRREQRKVIPKLRLPRSCRLAHQHRRTCPQGVVPHAPGG